MFVTDMLQTGKILVKCDISKSAQTIEQYNSPVTTYEVTN